MELARTNYLHQVSSFAMDLKLMKESHGLDSPFWPQSGLFEKDEDIPAFFETVDSVVTLLATPSSQPLSDRLFKAHSMLLNTLAHFNGLPPSDFGTLPDPPTFETRHAPFAPIVVTDDAPATELSVGPPVTDLAPLEIFQESAVPEASTSGISTSAPIETTQHTPLVLAPFLVPRTPPPEVPASETEADVAAVARDVIETAVTSDDDNDAPVEKDIEGSEGSGSGSEEAEE